MSEYGSPEKRFTRTIDKVVKTWTLSAMAVQILGNIVVDLNLASL